MPAYIAPGVYVEETSLRPKSIAGVATHIAGFIGPTLTGPLRAGSSLPLPDAITSLLDYERIYGAGQAIATDSGPETNFMWHAARAFFDNGGRRLRVARMDPLAKDRAAELAAGLSAFEAIDDIAVIAAPGLAGWSETEAVAGVGQMRDHVEKMRYRVAVIDSLPGQDVQDVRSFRAHFDSSRLALYYPWVRGNNPYEHTEIMLPPCGYVAGIYARNDIERGVWKAPANEIVVGALGFETMLDKARQDVLNVEGINCFRFFNGRGMRLWGARTLSSDPEWKYVNVRRYLNYLERSIDLGTRWAVFEPAGETLWARVREIINDFLLNEWQQGVLLGDRPEKAYFVRCDLTTMTQNDLDHGRLICLIGVAALKPAEFIIFRIGQ